MTFKAFINEKNSTCAPIVISEVCFITQYFVLMECWLPHKATNGNVLTEGKEKLLLSLHAPQISGDLRKT